MNDSQIIEVWDTFKEYILEKNKETAANQYIEFLLSNDVESSTLESLLGYDTHLDVAIKNVISVDTVEDDYDEYDDYIEEDY